ncbi:MAG: CocE/NonD family hydrolase [Kiritimatiellae bacterium]|nr:CocE/NonD family hydrolase [Kiritimatiellia bacterium]
MRVKGMIGALACWAAFGAFAEITVDDKIPAGNIVFEKTEGDVVYVHQDLRDTQGPWFYWAMRVKGAAGRTLTFKFTKSVAVGVRGPVVSVDRGKTYRFAAQKDATRNSFVYAFGKDADEVWFYECHPYLQKDWDAFLAQNADARGKTFTTGVLCKSRKGRDVPCARFGCIGKEPRFRVLMTSRHHCSETMATFALEGFCAAFFDNDEHGEWLRRNVEAMVVPFVDYDGAMDGDQGKNRRPHDHNRDYGAFVHPETKALADWVKKHADNRVDVAMDMHCPWLFGDHNEWLYCPMKNPKHYAPGGEAREKRFSELLQKLQTGGYRYSVDNDLAFGVGWNTDGNYQQGMPCTMWALKTFKPLVGRCWEIPFANANGAIMVPAMARQLGRDLAAVCEAFLEEEDAKRPGAFQNNVRVPMRDGVNLAADVYLPTNRPAEKIGCLLQFSPYQATRADKPWWAERAEEWGVATVSADCRGLCNAEGKFEPWDPLLPKDAYDLLEWISTRPWSNGRVVMVGGSYPGATQLACMRSGHPALVACAPSVVTFDPYSINYANGVLIPQFFKAWHSGLAGAESWAELERHPTRDAWWAVRSTLGDLKKSRGRAFYQAGWFDMLGVQTFESLRVMPKGSFLRIGPWSHGVDTFDNPEINYKDKGGFVTEDMEIEFLRSALAGRDSETAKAPGHIFMFVMGRNEWRYEKEWPLARTQWTKLHFDADKKLTWGAPARGADSFAYDPANPTPSRGGRIIHAGGQYDQTEIEKRADVMTYTGDVLEEDLEVTGPVRADLFVASTAAESDVAVKLVDVHPDGKAYNVVDGICRAKYAAGQPIRLQFQVDVTAYVFLKGHRVRVEIAGANSPHYAKSPNAATQTLLRGGPNGSCLVLPVIPAAKKN